MNRVLVSLGSLLIFAVLVNQGCSPSGQTTTSRPDPAHFEIPDSDEGMPGVGPVRRYDWFRELWRERRSAWAEQRDRDRGALVFLGDSITQGWGDELGGAFPGVRVANRGISGDTTRGMLFRLEEDVLSLSPSGVVMLFGTNDLEEGAEPAQVASNLRLILEALTDFDPRLPVVLCQVFPSSETKQRPADRIQSVNRHFQEVVRDFPQVRLLDTWTLFAGPDGNARPEEFPDLLHPNEQGYAQWAAALRPVLATLGFVENEPDPFLPEPGWESLFNGRDLTGWMFRPTSAADIEARTRWHASDPNAAAWPVLTEPATFPGQSATPDGRYVARNGRLVVTIPAEGRRIQQLWTEREFDEDFVLRLEFRATPNADSGIFIRGHQLQCRDYLLAGPYRDLRHYRPQDWNEIEITVRGNRARATCNGEVLEESLEIPASGPIGLEGDRGQVEYRRIRIGQIPG